MNRAVPFLVLLALVVSAAAQASAYEVMAKPEKGQPYPGNNQTTPYEDVLDISDLALAGKVVESGGGKVKIAVERVLHGKLEAKEAEVGYEGEFGEGVLDKGKTVTLLCIRGEDGKLCLAANPPKGGGLVAEGPTLVEKLVEAAADPAKGYASKDPAVKLSSAYRLARAWLAAPADKKPELPEKLVETLIDGLLPGDLRGRHVNSSSRNALNLLFDCDINQAFRYSVNSDADDRQNMGESMMNAWKEAVGKAAEVKAQQSKAPAIEPAAEEARAAKLVEQLGNAEWALRQEAYNALLKMGKPALKAVSAGAGSKDAEIGESCKLLLRELSGEKKNPEDVVEVRPSPFTPDKVMPFVESKPAKPGEKPPAKPKDEKEPEKL